MYSPPGLGDAICSRFRSGECAAIQYGDEKVPFIIRQGPLIIKQAVSSNYSWYQVGAIGDSASFNYVAANVTIKTVYDKVNDDAHSYWVGGHLSNGAFIQVGYLTSVSTNGLPYCCAWFYEYFPAGQDECCDPVIGPEGSAGPIGSSHTYSMVHTGSGVWTFHMDGTALGSTPNLNATSSGNNAPAGIAEVAQSSTNTDILGPAEFSGMLFRTGTSGWQSVPSGNSLITYGEGTRSDTPPNLYGVAEVVGVNNNFLAGSEIPQLDPPMSSPGQGLWPVSAPQELLTALFLDADQLSFTPDWVSFRRPVGTSRIFYTDRLKQNYQNLGIEAGYWIVDKVLWHSVNVAGQGGAVSIPTTAPLVVQTSVSSLRLRVSGIIFGLPVSRADVLTTLPDTTSSSATTDPSGLVVIRQLPPGKYYVRITVPYGISTITTQTLPAPERSLGVLGQVEVLMAVSAPIVVAVFVTIFAVQRERKRAALILTIPIPAPYPSNCPNCRMPIQADVRYCSNCGTLLKSEPPSASPSII